MHRTFLSILYFFPFRSFFFLVQRVNTKYSTFDQRCTLIDEINWIFVYKICTFHPTRSTRQLNCNWTPIKMHFQIPPNRNKNSNEVKLRKILLVNWFFASDKVILYTYVSRVVPFLRDTPTYVSLLVWRYNRDWIAWASVGAAVIPYVDTLNNKFGYLFSLWWVGFDAIFVIYSMTHFTVFLRECKSPTK